jgi:Zn-dependent protease
MFRFRLLPRLARRLRAESAISAGSVGGVRILIHPSALFLGLVVLTALSAHVAPALLRFASPVAQVAASAVVTFLLFLSILAREWARTVAAEREGIASSSIVFTLFGGVAILERDPADPGADYRIAVAGPLASVVVALGFSAATVTFANVPGAEPFVPLAGALALANTLFASLQAFPALPLDGGKVLRSMLWRVNGCRDRSSWLAARTSRWFALSMIAIGLTMLVRGQALGVVAVFAGWAVGEWANGVEEQARAALAAQTAGGTSPGPEVVGRVVGSPEPATRGGRLQLTNARARNATMPGTLPSTPNAPPVHESDAADDTSRSATSS